MVLVPEVELVDVVELDEHDRREYDQGRDDDQTDVRDRQELLELGRSTL